MRRGALTRNEYQSNMSLLYKPGGRVVRGYSYGELTEVRYLDVVPIGIESPERDEFIQLLSRRSYQRKICANAASAMLTIKVSASIAAGKNFST